MSTDLIDADGCPVVNLTIQCCRSHKDPLWILYDIAHQILRERWPYADV